MAIQIRRIQHLERLLNSKSGNPRWRVHFEGDFTPVVTRTDSTISYSLANDEFAGVDVSFSFDEQGKINGARPVNEKEVES